MTKQSTPTPPGQWNKQWQERLGRRLSVYEVCRTYRWAEKNKRGTWKPERLQSYAAIHFRDGCPAMGKENAGPGIWGRYQRQRLEIWLYLFNPSLEQFNFSCSLYACYGFGWRHQICSQYSNIAVQSSLPALSSRRPKCEQKILKCSNPGNPGLNNKDIIELHFSWFSIQYRPDNKINNLSFSEVA